MAIPRFPGGEEEKSCLIATLEINSMWRKNLLYFFKKFPVISHNRQECDLTLIVNRVLESRSFFPIDYGFLPFYILLSGTNFKLSKGRDSTPIRVMALWLCKKGSRFVSHTLKSDTRRFVTRWTNEIPLYLSNTLS